MGGVRLGEPKINLGQHCTSRTHCTAHTFCTLFYGGVRQVRGPRHKILQKIGRTKRGDNTLPT